MKSMKCDMCDHVAEGATFEEWMESLKPHYMEAHPEVMSDPTKTKEHMMAWMAENKAKFDAI